MDGFWNRAKLCEMGEKLEKNLPEATVVTHARKFAETSSWTHVEARWKWSLVHGNLVLEP